MIRLARAGLVSILLMTLVTGCMSPKGDTAADKRQAAQSMRSETLAQLYKVHSYAKTQIDQAVGYGVFSSLALQLHSRFDMGFLRCGLVGSSPDGPCDDFGRLDSALSKFCCDAANFLH